MSQPPRIPPPSGPGPRYGTDLDHACVAFESAVVLLDGVDPLTTEIVRLRCARYHDCRRCRSVRLEAALEQGFDEEWGAKIDRWETSDLDERYKAALALTDAIIMAPHAIDPALRQRVRAHFSDAEIAEICLDVMKWSVQKVLVALRIEPAAADDHLSRLTFDEQGRFLIGGPVAAAPG